MGKILFALCSGLLACIVLSGCQITQALQAVQSVNNARSGYQAYEAFSMAKSVKDKTPVFKDYRLAFVSADVQPRNNNADEVNKAMAEAYSRTINDMAKELGLSVVCKPYSQAEVETVPDALIIQIQEVKLSTVGKVMSGENIHATAKYIDKKSAKILVEEEFNPLKSYDAMIGIMSSSAMVKMLGNGPTTADGSKPSETEQKAWGEKAKKFINEKSSKYPIITPEEKLILAKG
jgi:hypothetical protein